MSTATQPSPVATPAPPAGRLRTRQRRRALWPDQLVIFVLGAAGCILSFDALRQVALAAHVSPNLTYLFPIVIDGFIAYGVRALLVLRDAPWHARAYVWTLFAAATAASLWANALHSVRLNQPGARFLILGNHTVAVLSAIAPLALGGATHLHILVTRHSRRNRPADTGDHAADPAAGTPGVIPAATSAIPATPSTPIQANPPAAPVLSAAGTGTTAIPHPAAESPTDGRPHPAPGDDAGQDGTDDSGRRLHASRGGRRAEASIEQLAEIIAQAHPGTGQITRAMARNAIEA
ncbi:DUF2637 domain-containing protein [Streptomyces sp. NPDC001380]|uniref:DUF2637 domain-containing protein n=1 Tax=Streptomyces sp. NPDC001380 TaxID=3364566 RepID=UPI00367DA0C1